MQNLLFAIIALLCIGAVLALVLWIAVEVMKWRMRRQGWVEGPLGWMPLRIHVVCRANTPPYFDEEPVTSWLKEIDGLGFEYFGCFWFKEIPERHTWAWLSKDRRVGLGLHSGRARHPTISLTVDPSDEVIVSYSNSKEEIWFDPCPNWNSINITGASVTALYQRIVSDWGRKELRLMSLESIGPQIERAYALRIDWYVTRGGYTGKELQAYAATKFRQYSDEQLSQIVNHGRRNAISVLPDLIKLQIDAKPVIEQPSGWNDVRDRVVIIHDFMNLDEAAEIAQSKRSWFDRQTQANLAEPAGMSAREFFVRINMRLPSQRQFSKLGEVSVPLGADLYLRPSCPATRGKWLFAR